MEIFSAEPLCKSLKTGWLLAEMGVKTTVGWRARSFTQFQRAGPSSMRGLSGPFVSVPVSG